MGPPAFEQIDKPSKTLQGDVSRSPPSGKADDKGRGAGVATREAAMPRPFSLKPSLQVQRGASCQGFHLYRQVRRNCRQLLRAVAESAQGLYDAAAHLLHSESLHKQTPCQALDR